MQLQEEPIYPSAACVYEDQGLLLRKQVVLISSLITKAISTKDNGKAIALK
jgi:hypothetical protein